MNNDWWNCFVFHDVDLIPENERNIYSCIQTPRHLSVTIRSNDHEIFDNQTFGGVTSLNKKQMIRVNGYSNLYFGHGTEGLFLCYYFFYSTSF